MYLIRAVSLYFLGHANGYFSMDEQVCSADLDLGHDRQHCTMNAKNCGKNFAYTDC